MGIDNDLTLRDKLEKTFGKDKQVVVTKKIRLPDHLNELVWPPSTLMQLKFFYKGYFREIKVLSLKFYQNKEQTKVHVTL